ncbi:MAG: hypothetical protein HYR64_01240 [Fimbriimonas ginsengisoli]|uniref:Uncharacterized protein n=1 Tax=Fimbriimonas ginsengisoli TaxID=1005039 RepID=A0A931PVL8_FIMGI|nr:hypothetical protein [Fimbriimonas ginsengisoli]
MRRKGLLFAATAIVIIGLATWLVMRAGPSRMARLHEDFQEQIRLARKEGLATEPADLDRLGFVPDDQNAAPLYNAIFKKIAAEPWGAKTALWRHDAMRPDVPGTVNVARADLVPFQTAFDDLRIASKRPGCDFKRNWRRMNVHWSVPGWFRLAVRGLCKSAHLDSVDGKTEQAANDLETAARMAHHLGLCPDPIMSSQSLALTSEVQDTVWQVAQERTDLPSLRAARQALGACELPRPLHESIGGQIVTLSELAMATEEDFGRLNGLGRIRSQYRLGKERDAIDHLGDYALDVVALQAIRKQYAALKAGSEVGPRARHRQEEVNSWMAGQKDLDLTVFARDPDRAVIELDIALLVEKFTRSLARTRAMLVGISLLERRAKDGQFPQTLPDVGEIGMDPLTDKPWVYRREGNGFRLSSARMPSSETGRVRPLEFVFPRPAPRAGVK